MSNLFTARNANAIANTAAVANVIASPQAGLSAAELDAELVSTLPEREEMHSFHFHHHHCHKSWDSCRSYDSCYSDSSCYSYDSCYPYEYPCDSWQPPIVIDPVRF